MLPLIFLPLLVVVSLAILLYLFFRRLPEVEERARLLSTGDTGPLLSTGDRMKKIFLGIIERFARWSRLLSLKVHNRLGILATAAREARIRTATRISERKGNQVAPLPQFSVRSAPPSVMMREQNERSEDIAAGDSSRNRNRGAKESEYRKSIPSQKPSEQSPSAMETVSPMVRKWFEGTEEKEKRGDVLSNSEHVAHDEPRSLKEESGRESLAHVLRSSSEEGTLRRRASDIGRKFGGAVRRFRSPGNTPPPNIEVPMKKDQLEDILVERISMNPRDTEAYERLGDYYLEQNNLSDAKECYRQVLKLSPAYRLVKIKIRRLERLLEKERLP